MYLLFEKCIVFVFLTLCLLNGIARSIQHIRPQPCVVRSLARQSPTTSVTACPRLSPMCNVPIKFKPIVTSNKRCQPLRYTITQANRRQDGVRSSIFKVSQSCSCPKHFLGREFTSNLTDICTIHPRCHQRTQDGATLSPPCSSNRGRFEY